MPNRAVPSAPKRPDGPKIPGPKGPAVSSAPVAARPPAPPVYRPHPPLAPPKAPPIYRPVAAGKAVSPKMMGRQAAPPVYRPARGPVQMTPTTWRSAVEVATVESLKSGWTLKSRWPAIKDSVAAYGQLRDDDLRGRRQVLGQLTAAIDKWKKNQANNKWGSDLDLSKKNAVRALEFVIQQELTEIHLAESNRVVPTPISRSVGLGLGSNSNSLTITISNRNDSPPPRSRPIGMESRSTSPPPHSSRRLSVEIFGLDFEDDGDGSSSQEIRRTVPSSPPIGRGFGFGLDNHPKSDSYPFGTNSFQPTISFREDLDNEPLNKLGLRTYLHFTKEHHLKSIGEKGLIAGFQKGIGAPETGEPDPTNVYVVSGSSGASFASGEGGGHPIAVITSGSPGRDPNYKGGAYMFYKEIPPMHSFVSDGTTFSFNLPPDGATKIALASFVNRHRFGKPLSVEEAWQMVRADLLVRFRLHLMGEI